MRMRTIKTLKRVLSTRLMLSNIMEHTYTMGQVMENSRFGIIIIRDRFKIEVMNTKLNSQNIFGS